MTTWSLTDMGASGLAAADMMSDKSRSPTAPTACNKINKIYCVQIRELWGQELCRRELRQSASWCCCFGPVELALTHHVNPGLNSNAPSRSDMLWRVL